MKTWIQFGGIGIGLLAGLLMSGCELSSGSSSTTAATSDVSGTWSYSDSKSLQSTWALVQTSDDVIAGSGTEGEKITGSISSDTVSLTVTNTSGLSILTGTVSGSTITGSYTNTIYGSGSWTAVKTD